MRRFLYTLVLLIFAAGCEKNPTPNPDPDPPVVPRDDISQYDARLWDGTKRGGVFYEIFVRSFADSNNDGIGDIRGITAKKGRPCEKKSRRIIRHPPEADPPTMPG